MSDGKLGRALHGVSIVDHSLQQGPRSRGKILHVVTLDLHLLHHPMNGSENVEVGRRAHIALIRREAEHRDGQLLLIAGFDPQGRPANRPFSDGINTILERVCLSCGVVTAR